MRSVALAAALVLMTGSGVAGESTWKEMEAFHMAMAETFHPAEEGNLQPVREQAGDLLAKAKTWQASPVPSDYDQAKTVKALQALVEKCERVEAAVKAKQDDAQLTKLITEAHDAFHAIIGECKTTDAEKH